MPLYSWGREVTMKNVITGGLAASAGLLLFMLRNAFRTNLKRGTIRLKSDARFDPFELMFISDIHRRKLPGTLIDFPVDVIIVGGDLVEGGVPLDRVERNLALLSRHAPVYFVWGNNDREIDEEKLYRLFKRYGITVLEDESVALMGNPQLKLVGLDYFAYQKNGMEKAFAEVDETDTVIFATHTPFVFDKVKSKYRMDFGLAGHTHGGQIRFGSFGIYKKGRLMEDAGAIQLISNGFGTTKLPLRLGAEAEYHLFTVCPK